MTESSPEPHIGSRLRELRRATGHSLTWVASQIGISASALSQIETGAMQPSVNRLVEIVGVLNAPVGAIFDGHQVLYPPHTQHTGSITGSDTELQGVLVRRNSVEDTTELGQGVRYRPLAPHGVPGVDLFESTYPPGASSSADGGMLVHQGYEVGHVSTGTLRFDFTEGAVTLTSGDSLAFWATRPHRVTNPSTSEPAVATWLTLLNPENTSPTTN